MNQSFSNWRYYWRYKINRTGVTNLSQLIKKSNEQELQNANLDIEANDIKFESIDKDLRSSAKQAYDNSAMQNVYFI